MQQEAVLFPVQVLSEGELHHDALSKREGIDSQLSTLTANGG